MSNKELIYREDVKAKKVYCDERHEYVVPVAEIDWLSPVVQHEMTVKEYQLIKRRLCKNCPVCPLNEAAMNLFIDCKRFEREYPDEAATIIAEWAREHPVRKDTL